LKGLKAPTQWGRSLTSKREQLDKAERCRGQEGVNASVYTFVLFLDRLRVLKVSGTGRNCLQRPSFGCSKMGEGGDRKTRGDPNGVHTGYGKKEECILSTKFLPTCLGSGKLRGVTGSFGADYERTPDLQGLETIRRGRGLGS